MTILLTPPLMVLARRALDDDALASGALQEDVQREEQAHADHVLVIGLGPVGRAVTRAVTRVGVPVVGVELNSRAEVQFDDADSNDARSRRPRASVVFGDASRPEILSSAGVAAARLVVVTLPEPTIARTVIAQVGQLAPGVPVIARGRYNRFLEQLSGAGAEQVIDEEEITGREIAHAALLRLGVRIETD